MLKLYNSKSKKIESAQLNKDDVKIYLCGPTVQSEPHIGHGRSAVVFDILVRYLRFKEYKVKFVRNRIVPVFSYIWVLLPDGLPNNNIFSESPKPYNKDCFSLTWRH